MARELHISGLAELDAALKALPTKVEVNVMRGALRAGHKTIADLARAKLAANGSVDTGALRDSIRIGRLKTKSKKFGWLRYDLIAGDATAWYAHLVEYGTASYYTGKGKSVRKPYEIKPRKRASLFIAGLMRETVTHPGAHPKPFMRPALDEGAQPAFQAVADYVRSRLPREVAKLAKAAA